MPIDYKGDILPRFKHRNPEGSRADIRAKGRWKDRRWAIEFERNLTTGHKDDIQFDVSREYRFGISRYEIAGRYPNGKLSQPLYGCGDVSNNIILSFSQK